jgi:hypothetical protein
MVMEVRELQLRNASLPILVTLDGMLVTVFNFAVQVCPEKPSNTVILPVDDVNVYVAPLSAVSNTILMLVLVVTVIGTVLANDGEKVKVNDIII